MSIFTNRASSSAAEAKEYTVAILGLVGERNPMEVLASTDSGIRRLIEGLSDAELSRPEASGRWSVRQIVQHVADSDLVWGWRLRMVLAHDRPQITGYDQDLWAERLHYDETKAAEALDEFRVLRRANLRLLTRATPAERKRVGIHSERGEESVEHMMGMYAGHDLLHLRQIERVRGALVR